MNLNRLICVIAVGGLIAFLPLAASASEPAEAPDGHSQAHAGSEEPTTATHLDNWWSLSYGPGKAHQNPPLGWALVNFAILLFLLYRLAGKPFTKYLQQRRDQVKNALDQASAMRKAAREKLAEIDDRLKGLDDEVAAIRRDVKADAELERARIISAAETEADRIVQAADRTMREEIKRIRAQLEVEAVDAAISAAEKLLRKSVTDADRKRLDEQYLTQFNSGGGN